MPVKVKDTVENVKTEAKSYYKDKNMILRYVFITFLLILVGLQFFLPSKKDTILQQEIKTPIVVDQILDKEVEAVNSSLYTYLDRDFFANNSSLVDIDTAKAEILGDPVQTKLLYKKSLSIFQKISPLLDKYEIPQDMKYLSLLNQFKNPLFVLDDDTIDQYGLIVNKDIDQTLDQDMMIDVYISYIQDLYDVFQNRELVTMAFMIGKDNLLSLMEGQDVGELFNLYVPGDSMLHYYSLIGYKQIFDNISTYIDTSSINLYNVPETKNIILGQTKNLIKRSQKEGYTFKEIKEFNPWILGNSLPKGERYIKVNKKKN